MRHILWKALRGIAVLAATRAVAAPDAATVRKELEAEYAKMAAAFKKKDAAGVLSTMAADAEAKLPGGKVLHRSDFEASLKEQLATVKSVKSMRYKLDEVTVKGATAIAKVTGTSAVVIADKQGKDHTVEQINTVRNVWAKTAQGWRIKMAEPLSLKVFLDGKPVK